jgi:hypothetical protein
MIWQSIYQLNIGNYGWVNRDRRKSELESSSGGRWREVINVKGDRKRKKWNKIESCLYKSGFHGFLMMSPEKRRKRKAELKRK